MLTPALALLALTAQQPQDFTIDLYVGVPVLPVAHTIFRPGEVVRLWVETSEDAYVTVLDVTPQSNVRLAYPYHVDSEIPRFTAGEIHPLSVDPIFFHWVAPSPRAGGWGPGYLVAIASRQPIQLRTRLARLGMLARWDTRYFSVHTGFVSQGAILDLLDAEFAGDDVTAVVVRYDVVAPITRLASLPQRRAACPFAFAQALSDADVAAYGIDCLLQRDLLKAAMRHEPVTKPPRPDTSAADSAAVDPRRKDTVAVDRERLRPDAERERFVEGLREWNPAVAERLRETIRPPTPPEQQDPIEEIRRVRPELAERLRDVARGEAYAQRQLLEALAAQQAMREARWRRLHGYDTSEDPLRGYAIWTATSGRGRGGSTGAGWTPTDVTTPSSPPTPVTPATPPAPPTPRVAPHVNRQIKPERH